MQKAIKKLVFVEKNRVKSENICKKPLLKVFLAVCLRQTKVRRKCKHTSMRNCFRKYRTHVKNVQIGLHCNCTEGNCFNTKLFEDCEMTGKQLLLARDHGARAQNYLSSQYKRKLSYWSEAYRMGAVRITSLNPKFSGSYFGLPPSSIHKMTSWVANSRILWRMRTVPIGCELDRIRLCTYRIHIRLVKTYP